MCIRLQVELKLIFEHKSFRRLMVILTKELEHYSDTHNS